jgi:hypothetical protein
MIEAAILGVYHDDVVDMSDAPLIGGVGRATGNERDCERQ